MKINKAKKMQKNISTIAHFSRTRIDSAYVKSDTETGTDPTNTTIITLTTLNTSGVGKS